MSSDDHSPYPLDACLSFSIGQTSSAGVKPINEDAIGIRIPDGQLLTSKGAVAVIADGVSAAEAGREASETCVRNFLSDYYSTPDSWSVKKSSQQILTALNRWLYGQSQRYRDQSKGFVTTLSVLIFKSHSAHLFHIGDSRVYRLRDGELELLSRDHAMPVSNNHRYLTRAMGLDIHVEVDYQQIDLEVGDSFLLTTDGIHDFVPAPMMTALIAGHSDYETAAEELLALALAQGSDDNLSCQLLRVEQLPAADVDDVVSRLTQLPFPPFLSVGMVLDGYRIERELHASSRSQLYLVTDVQSGESYCMKTPSVNFEDDPAYIERFIMESWIGRRIHNTHVVNIVEPARSKTCLYYLMEYVDGLSLAQWIRENPKPAVQEVVYLVDQVARGLRAFHRKEILHQDIKPDNILIDRYGLVKIVDFGSCYAPGIAEIAVPIEREVALGTVSYSAPEYSVKKRPVPQSDIFSLAVVTFEMLTGELPFGGALERCTSPEQFLKTSYTAAYRINPLVPVWIDGALRKSLRYQPQRRHQEVSELVYELQHPNNKYLEREFQPLLQRDPVLVWKLLAGGLAVTQLLSLFFLLR
jgi:serine/threonine protein phosphatase PrpC